MRLNQLTFRLCLLLMLVALVSACAAPAVPPAATQAAPADTPAAPADTPAAPADTPAASAAVTDTTAAAATSGDMDALIAAAKAEGTLTTIALPHDWCNYGEVIESFKTKYGIEVNELNPGGGSGDEIEAIRANKDNKGPQAPDVIDVGLSFGPQAQEEGLIQPYKVSTWDSIPDTAKDADGNWYGDYYGVLSFEVNSDAVTTVPKDWADLLNPDYNGQVALAGDPRVSNQAIQSVVAAGLANGGSLEDPTAGLDFFAKLNAAGNLVPVIANAGTIATGETPIVVRWDYLSLADRDTLAGNPNIETVVPASGVFAGVYVQAISAYAPHPNAAKLWMEHLYSDEGQLMWLKGYCHPIRYNDLVARNVIPSEIADKLPSADLYAAAVFPTLEQLNAASDVVTKQWDTVVKADVKAAP